MTPLLAWRQILDTGQSLCLGGYQVGVQSLDPPSTRALREIKPQTSTGQEGQGPGNHWLAREPWPTQKYDSTGSRFPIPAKP